MPTKAEDGWMKCDCGIDFWPEGDKTVCPVCEGEAKSLRVPSWYNNSIEHAVPFSDVGHLGGTIIVLQEEGTGKIQIWSVFSRKFIPQVIRDVEAKFGVTIDQWRAYRFAGSNTIFEESDEWQTCPQCGGRFPEEYDSVLCPYCTDLVA